MSELFFFQHGDPTLSRLAAIFHDFLFKDQIRILMKNNTTTTQLQPALISRTYYYETFQKCCGGVKQVSKVSVCENH